MEIIHILTASALNGFSLPVLDALALLLLRMFWVFGFAVAVAKAPGEGQGGPCAVGDPLPVQQQRVTDSQKSWSPGIEDIPGTEGQRSPVMRKIVLCPCIKAISLAVPVLQNHLAGLIVCP